MVTKYSDGLSKKSVLKSGHIEQSTVRSLPVLAFETSDFASAKNGESINIQPKDSVLFSGTR